MQDIITIVLNPLINLGCFPFDDTSWHKYCSIFVVLL